jgi:hypothetical protein
MKTIQLLLALVISFDVMAGAGTFPQGANVKLLKDSLKFKTGMTIGKSAVNPLVVATPADQGSLLLSNDRLYLKKDDGMTTNWRMIDLPDQTGSLGKVLTTNGNYPNWGNAERLNAKVKNNLLINPSFETSGGLGTLTIFGGFNISGVTTRTLQASPHNTSAYDIRTTAAHGFTWFQKGLAADFTGRTMSAYCEIRTDRDDVYFKAFSDNITQVSELKVSNDNTWKYYKIPFTATGDPSMSVDTKGLVATGVTKIDNCFIGVSDNTQEIGTAHFVGDQYSSAAGCIWDKTTLDIQIEAFRHQIQLAKHYKLPIVIHCREAFDEIFEVLEQEKSNDLYGIFHCFTGNLEQARKAISYNMKLGIGGVVTFKNGKIDQFINQVDLKHIVLETDAPYLAPKPYRGKRNESAFINKVVEKLSELYQMSEADIASITTQNSKDVFGI